MADEAITYHQATRHSPYREWMQGNVMDFNNMPIPYKVYRDLPRIPLVDPLPPSSPPAPLDFSTLGRLLHNAIGITRVIQRGARQFVFRAAACTGALYEIELYVVCGDLPGLPAGVYHYSPRDRALDRLREGDFRRTVSGGQAAAPVIVCATGTYWRNAWKYQARTYRHFGWDNGMVMANLLATASALGQPARLLTGFVDGTLSSLLALDDAQEVTLSLVPIGHPDSVPASPDCPALHPQTEPLSPHGDIDFPIMRQLHAASSITSPDQLTAWRTPQGAGASGPAVPGLDTVIARRGSTRQFDHRSLTQPQVSDLLQYGMSPIESDVSGLNDVYAIVHAVDGLESGVYVYEQGQLTLLKAGNFRREAGFLDLGQDLAADAALNIYFMANLDEVLGRYGNRGYRAVQLEAGLMGGRMYLSAYSAGFGATGLTFYDDEVTRFLSPHAAAKSPIFLMAFGHKAR